MATSNKGNPLFNPVLTLLKTPSPKTVQGGGKNEKSIKHSRLNIQRSSLSKTLKDLSKRKSELKQHNGKIHLLAKMFYDSHASSWTPKDIFRSEYGGKVIAPAFDGYLIEADVDNLDGMATKITSSLNIVDRVDISRVESLHYFDSEQVLRSKPITELWPKEGAHENVEFNFWLMPFGDIGARKSVRDDLISFYKAGALTVGDDEFPNPFRKPNITDTTEKQRFEGILNRYIDNGIVSFSAKVNSIEDLNKIAASGTTYRIEPVATIAANSTPPGDGKEPSVPKEGIDELPVVVIVDGGRSAKSYETLEVWSAPPLVNEYLANQVHGNQITSLVCHGHAWNNNLSLPELACRFVTAQAITKDGVKKQPTQDQFIDYLEEVAKKTKDISRVWNLSFNEIMPSKNPDEISSLGHKINSIARKYDLLPVISIGNKNKTGNTLLCPPADCEAALTVSGRKASPTGEPSASCSISLKGPAPSGMKKPDLSWFSQLRMIGGVTNIGSSYSAALISSLASHTFKNLKKPTPDLVRALMINGSDRQAHCNELGWGTPWAPDQLPWVCKEGTVTLAWVSKLRPGFAYYWNDIPVPTEMIKNGKLYGKASLTAIIKPIVSELGGANYFATRLQVSLQADSVKGKPVPLLGSMKESKEKEETARSELAKWSPIRRHANKFSGRGIDMNSMRLYARVYTRDLYQFNVESHHALDEQEVAFVLTFEGIDGGPDIYNSMSSRLGAQVENAVIEQGIDVTLEGQAN